MFISKHKQQNTMIKKPRTQLSAKKIDFSALTKKASEMVSKHLRLSLEDF